MESDPILALAGICTGGPSLTENLDEELYDLWIDSRRFEAAFALRQQYQNKPRISFTDFTSFVVMRELQVRRALTRDGHFRQFGLGFTTLP